MAYVHAAGFADSSRAACDGLAEFARSL